MARPLGADERALWERVIATVQPLHRRPQASAEPAVEANPDAPAAKAPPRGRVPPPRPIKPAPPPPRTHIGATLDGNWDRRLGKGVVQPDRMVDLHGHHLGSAYSLLDARLEEAIASGARVMLLVTGKPPTGADRPVARGAIRAAVGDWLAASRHADAIAAVRNAHPRHGGTGALYIVLRRSRPRP
jgi:DNA-nicking Smr family endonuclease